MDKPLEILPGEGETKTVTSRRIRKGCDVCGERADYQVTYLLPNARRNPASSAYGRDDCSWCSDTIRHYCAECCKHGNRWPEVEGYETCSMFPAIERFAHMFLEWVEAK